MPSLEHVGTIRIGLAQRSFLFVVAENNARGSRVGRDDGIPARHQ